jgi:TonB family protein
VRISAAILIGAVLLPSLSAQAQTAPAGAAPAEPVVTQPKPPASKQGIISDTQGVDLNPYMKRMYRIVQSSWNPLIPREATPPVNKSGIVVIRFKILPNGQLQKGGMTLEGRSGDEALDRAAWGAITTSVFPPLPAKFKGPYIEVRFSFLYNLDRQPAGSKKLPKPPNLLGPVGMTLGYGSKL